MLILVFIIILILLVFDIKSPKSQNLPRLNFETSIKKEVKKISFKRNGLYLNKQQYNASGISWYSKFTGQDTILALDDIKPPFQLNKKADNDTLYLIKNNKIYYLLISNEIR